MISDIIVSYGSCVSRYIANSIPGYRVSKETDFNAKMSSSIVPPGDIADRLDSHMSVFIKSKKFTKLTKAQQSTIFYQIDDVIKKQSVTDIPIDKQDQIILVDFSFEIVPSVIYNNEDFMIRPNYSDVAQFFPTWFNNLVSFSLQYPNNMDPLTKEKWLQNTNTALDRIRNSNNHVIALDNVFTNKVWYQNKIRYADGLLLKSPPFNSTISTYNDVRQYLNDVYDRFKQMLPNATWVQIEDISYAGLDHPLGIHPTHLHESSYNLIASRINDAINSNLKSK